jgi:rhamnosyltransferase
LILIGCIIMPQNLAPSVGLVIPTLNAGARWIDCLSAIAKQTLKPNRLLNIDSGSSDETIRHAQSAGFEVRQILSSEFNHGGTRQSAAEHLSDCDLIVFLTQDALLASEDALSEIVRCFDDPSVAVAYGRQLPHRGATPIEAHARIFNYGTQTVKKSLTNSTVLGSWVFFCSNSFAAYRRSTLLKLGGFGRDLILGEDMEFAARAVKAGFANVYCAEAKVYHSHDYTIVQTVRRYFDIGVFDSENNWMRQEFGSHSGAGTRFIKSEWRYLDFYYVPRAMSLTFAKFSGYALGRLHRRLPRVIKQRLSMQASYWR